MVHYPIIWMTISTLKAPLHFTEISAILNFIGIFTLSFLVSILAMLTIEIPINNIYKLVISSSKVSNALKSANEQNNLNCEKHERKIK